MSQYRRYEIMTQTWDEQKKGLACSLSMYGTFGHFDLLGMHVRRDLQGIPYPIGYVLKEPLLSC